MKELCTRPWRTYPDSSAPFPPPEEKVPLSRRIFDWCLTAIFYALALAIITLTYLFLATVHP